jgi:hypothetical protein
MSIKIGDNNNLHDVAIGENAKIIKKNASPQVNNNAHSSESVREKTLDLNAIDNYNRNLILALVIAAFSLIPSWSIAINVYQITDINMRIGVYTIIIVTLVGLYIYLRK